MTVLQNPLWVFERMKTKDGCCFWLATSIVVLPERCIAQGLPSSSFGFDGLGVIAIALILSIYLNIRLVRLTNSTWMWLVWPVLFSLAYCLSFISGVVFEKLT